MKNLLLISHSYHSFLLNEIEYSSQCFDNVYIVTLFNQEIKNQFYNYQNVHLIFFEKKDLYKCAIAHLYTLLSLEKIDEQTQAIKDGLWDFDYLKKIIFFIGLEYVCKSQVKKIGINKKNEKSWSLLSCWYEADAYAVYKLKEKYQEVKTYSLCHSYEVDSKKSKYIYILFRKKYHQSFDLISFISKNVKSNFEREIAKKLNLSMSNVEVRYLGTQKKKTGSVSFNTIPPYHIVTCSYIIPVKRVFELFDILNKYADIPLFWTHIGEGKEYAAFRECVKNKLKNSNLKLNILGKKSNDEIHNFYIKEKVDLFLNYSISEGIPVSIMEAIAYGIPVLATDVGGNTEIVKPSFGTIIEVDMKPCDVWAEIKSMLTMNYEQKIEYQRAAIDFFEKNFDSQRGRIEFYKMISEYREV